MESPKEWKSRERTAENAFRRERSKVSGGELQAVVSPRVMSPHAGTVRPRSWLAVFTLLFITVCSTELARVLLADCCVQAPLFCHIPLYSPRRPLSCSRQGRRRPPPRFMDLSSYWPRMPPDASISPYSKRLNYTEINGVLELGCR